MREWNETDLTDHRGMDSTVDLHKLNQLSGCRDEVDTSSLAELHFQLSGQWSCLPNGANLIALTSVELSGCLKWKERLNRDLSFVLSFQ